MGASILTRLNRPGAKSSLYDTIGHAQIRVSNHSTVGGVFGPWETAHAEGVIVAWCEDYQPMIHIAVAGNGRLGALIVTPTEQDSIREFIAWLEAGPPSPRASRAWVLGRGEGCPSCRSVPGEIHLKDCAREKSS